MQTITRTTPSAPCMGRDHSPEIGLLAYFLWEAAGCPAGRDLDFWLQAEQQLLGPHKLNGQAPPSSHSGGSTPKKRATQVRAAKPKPRQPQAARKAAGARAAS